MAKLTDKQRRFVEEYLVDLNATQAAIRAGYSPDTANEQGSRLLANVSIRNEIEKAMAERSRRTGISQDRVIQELARIAFVNPHNLLDPDDASVREDATVDDLACIQSIKVKSSESEKGSSIEREVRLNDKLKALELLGKHLGMFKGRSELDEEEQRTRIAVMRAKAQLNDLEEIADDGFLEALKSSAHEDWSDEEDEAVL